MISNNDNENNNSKKHLEHYDVKNGRLHINTSENIPNVLREALEDKNNKITSMDLQYCNLGDEGFKVIAEALKTNTSLSGLYFGSHKMTNKQAEIIAEALKTNISLNTLYFCSVDITNKKAEYLAEALKTNTGIKTLGFIDNDITDKEAKIIAEALKANTGLDTLYLGHNITNDAIAEVLKVNMYITSCSYYGDSDEVTVEVKLIEKYLQINQIYVKIKKNIFNKSEIEVKAHKELYIIKKILQNAKEFSADEVKSIFDTIDANIPNNDTSSYSDKIKSVKLVKEKLLSCIPKYKKEYIKEIALAIEAKFDEPYNKLFLKSSVVLNNTTTLPETLDDAIHRNAIKINKNLRKEIVDFCKSYNEMIKIAKEFFEADKKSKADKIIETLKIAKELSEEEKINNDNKTELSHNNETHEIKLVGESAGKNILDECD